MIPINNFPKTQFSVRILMTLLLNEPFNAIIRSEYWGQRCMEIQFNEWLIHCSDEQELHNPPDTIVLVSSHIKT